MFAALMLVCMAEPEWPERKLEVGQQLLYSGQIKDSSDRPGKKYRHAYSLDVVIVVTSIREAVVECAVMTSVTPNAEQSIANATDLITGQKTPDKVIPTIRVELIRIPMNRTIELAKLSQAPPWAKLEYHADPGPPLDGPDYGESGVFVGKAHAKELTREWLLNGDAIWNGSRVLDYSGTQQSLHYQDTVKAAAGWKRVDRLQLSPIDGLPRSLTRVIEQREGKQVIAMNEVMLEMKPPVPAMDAKALRQAKLEAEMAAWFCHDAEIVVRDRKAMQAFRERAARWLVQQSKTPSVFRPALDLIALKEDRSVSEGKPN